MGSAQKGLPFFFKGNHTSSIVGAAPSLSDLFGTLFHILEGVGVWTGWTKRWVPLVACGGYLQGFGVGVPGIFIFMEHVPLPESFSDEDDRSTSQGPS